MFTALLMLMAIPTPPDDGLPPPKSAKIVAKTSSGPCQCGCGLERCRCAACLAKAKPVATTHQPTRKAVYRTQTRRVCNGGRCQFVNEQVFDHWEEVVAEKPLAVDEAAHTPMAEVVRVLALLPKPQVAFVDYGCGYDARWVIAAAEKWKCKAIGVEIDPRRARAARERVRNLGLAHLVTIVEGDATTANVDGDVAVAYLYPDVLMRLKPRLVKFRAVASYLHAVPDMPMERTGNSWIYRKPAVVMAPAQTVSRGAVWNGVVYSGPICNSPHCAMCQSLRAQISRQQ